MSQCENRAYVTIIKQRIIGTLFIGRFGRERNTLLKWAEWSMVIAFDKSYPCEHSFP